MNLDHLAFKLALIIVIIPVALRRGRDKFIGFIQRSFGRHA